MLGPVRLAVLDVITVVVRPPGGMDRGAGDHPGSLFSDEADELASAWVAGQLPNRGHIDVDPVDTATCEAAGEVGGDTVRVDRSGMNDGHVHRPRRGPNLVFDD